MSEFADNYSFNQLPSVQYQAHPERTHWCRTILAVYRTGSFPMGPINSFRSIRIIPKTRTSRISEANRLLPFSRDSV
jgi:hypothetical protein